MVEKNIEQKPKEEVIKIKKISEKYKEKKLLTMLFVRTYVNRVRNICQYRIS